MFTRLRICIGMTAAATIALIFHLILMRSTTLSTTIGLTLCATILWALYFIDKRK